MCDNVTPPTNNVSQFAPGQFTAVMAAAAATKSHELATACANASFSAAQHTRHTSAGITAATATAGGVVASAVIRSAATAHVSTATHQLFVTEADRRKQNNQHCHEHKQHDHHHHHHHQTPRHSPPAGYTNTNNHSAREDYECALDIQGVADDDELAGVLMTSANMRKFPCLAGSVPSRPGTPSEGGGLRDVFTDWVKRQVTAAPLELAGPMLPQHHASSKRACNAMRRESLET